MLDLDAEIAVEQSAHKGNQLGADRLVQPIPCAKCFDFLPGDRPVCAEPGKGISGCRPHEDKQQRQSNNEGNHRLNETQEQPTAHFSCSDVIPEQG